MLYPKIVVASTFQVFIVAFLLSYFKVKIPLPDLNLREKLSFVLRETKFFYHKSGAPTVPPIFSSLEEEEQPQAPTKQSRLKNLRVFSQKELASYDGSDQSKDLYLALLGRVYDVEKGRKHYGPDGGYHFFAGKDATRAFVTGDFTENGLVEDINGLQPQDLIAVEEWIQFYEKEYTPIGYVQGAYYDSDGRPTRKLKEAQKLFKNARLWQQSQKADLEKFPGCNSEWIQGKGGRVWCTNKSGGVTRDWVGVPRKLFVPGNGQSRCACVKDFGLPESGKIDDERSGDLDNPNLRLYDNCDPKAVSCKL